ncbi:hypothetical protein H5410_006990 [Solanum commersonii]|uniref:Uncharacterized protein n=1 Tax=Solanum commersonii TaxID=4109 RepID=A0A9J6ABT0_SOLCO|nr:hypothetical protein H5410_006990 [Solanum commersonii]
MITRTRRLNMRLRFQRTSSNEGRLCDSGEMHLLVSDITIDKDSWELVVSTAGSTILRLPSWLPKDIASLDKQTENYPEDNNTLYLYLLENKQQKTQQIHSSTFPMEPSPSNADLSKISVASSNSSMENTRYDGAPCDPSAAV